MNYIHRHWRGELSLAVSFWVNVTLLNIFDILIFWAIGASATYLSPVTYARAFIAWAFIAICIIYPWQLVGLWRCCGNHVEKKVNVGWARAAQTLVVIGLLTTSTQIKDSLPVYRDLFQLAFPSDAYQEYEVALTDDGRRIHVTGGMGFGVSDDVAELLDNHPNVDGIILDSIGGRIYEGRQLAALIRKHSLDTFSLTGCYSACATAFVAGKGRFLAPGANLAFHQYQDLFESVELKTDMETEQALDRAIFERSGISTAFLDRMFQASKEDLWYPTIDELREATVIHAIMSSADIKPLSIGGSIPDLVDQALQEISAYETIKAYEPELYAIMRDTIIDKARKGASSTEISDAVGSYFESLVMAKLPKADDRTITSFFQIFIPVLRNLDSRDPILCMKALYPDEYGALNFGRFVEEDQLQQILEIMGESIESAYSGKPRPIDIATAEADLAVIGTQLDVELEYLEMTEFAGRNDYSRHCNAFIGLYDKILETDRASAANILRYALSE